MHLGRANRTPATGFAPLTFFTRNLVILRDNPEAIRVASDSPIVGRTR